jgi:hypothetical protein
VSLVCNTPWAIRNWVDGREEVQHKEAEQSKTAPNRFRLKVDTKIEGLVELASEKYKSDGTPRQKEDEWLRWLCQGIGPEGHSDSVLVFTSAPFNKDCDPCVVQAKFEEDEQFQLIAGTAFLKTTLILGGGASTFQPLPFSVEKSNVNENSIGVPATSNHDQLLVVVRVRVREGRAAPSKADKYRMSFRVSG